MPDQVERFDFHVATSKRGSVVVKDVHGQWVYYSDCEKLEKAHRKYVEWRLADQRKQALEELRDRLESRLSSPSEARRLTELLRAGGVRRDRALDSIFAEANC